jgi:hypothetical protein
VTVTSGSNFLTAGIEVYEPIPWVNSAATLQILLNGTVVKSVNYSFNTTDAVLASLTYAY